MTCPICGKPTRIGSEYPVHIHSGLVTCDTVASLTIEPTFYGPSFGGMNKLKELLDTHRATAFITCHDGCFCWDVERWLLEKEQDDDTL